MLERLKRMMTRQLGPKLALGAMLVVAADFLFYGERRGWTDGAFALLLLGAATLAQADRLAQRRCWAIAAVASGLAAALVYDPSALAAWLYALTMIWLSLAVRGRVSDRPLRFALAMLSYGGLGWSRLSLDAGRVARRFSRAISWLRVGSSLLPYLVPVALALVFILLFATANPILARLFSQIDLHAVIRWLPISRVAFWVAMASIIWSVLRPRMSAWASSRPVKNRRPSAAGMVDGRVVLVSLALFNAIFLVENGLDAVFLWSGGALPAGVTHAEYAHEGAYPLIFTALLAGAYVLIAFRPGRTIGDVWLQKLLYAWVGQNVFLVFSSMLRLTSYIEDYSLTMLRVEALIWMALVALGLVLMVARIRLGKDNAWLIKANALALYATLYLCCFVDFGSPIAWYNVRHAHEITGIGSALDCEYLLFDSGAEAIPALLWFYKQVPLDPHADLDCRVRLACGQAVCELPTLELQALKQSLADWHSWTFHNQQLFNTITAMDPDLAR
jgi:Domain of unknown function (DUF4173)